MGLSLSKYWQLGKTAQCYILFALLARAFFEVIMTNKDFVNVKIKDRFHKDYELTDSEIKFALFCTYFVILGGLFGLFYWMLQIATRWVMQLHKLVENGYERAYCNMLNNIEMQDAKEEWIESRAEELIKNFGNDNDWQIIELLKIKLESKSIDDDIYNQFIVDICYSQARFEYNNQTY